MVVWFRRRRRESNEDAAAREIAELTASRRIIVDAYEVERRRIERDLHDGTQQYLVAAAMMIGEARLSATVASDPELAERLSLDPPMAMVVSTWSCSPGGELLRAW